MNNEEKKEYLRSYKQAVIAARCIETELREVKLAKRCPSILVDTTPCDTGDKHEYTVKVHALEEKLKQARYKRICLYTEIVDKIESMEREIDKNILRLKYIHNKTWEEVAEEINYGWTRTHELHREALKHFECE